MSALARSSLSRASVPLSLLAVATLLSASSCDAPPSSSLEREDPTAMGEPAASRPTEPGAPSASTGAPEPATPGDGGALPFRVPDESTIPDGEEGDLIRRGKLLASRTFEELPENVGNGLHCNTCHLGAGTVPNAAPWVGISARFPQYRSRAGREITLEERINSCFQRSMNGKALDKEGADMRAFIAYMDWLSQGYPKGSKVEGQGIPKVRLDREPDPERGKALYAARCATCHQVDGQGLTGPEDAYVFPALWGDRSYNVGAGMARLYTAAGFIKHNMPLGAGGTLTDDEAFDIAAYFAYQPRPDLEGKEHDWPKGGKPADARY